MTAVIILVEINYFYYDITIETSSIWIIFQTLDSMIRPHLASFWTVKTNRKNTLIFE